ncbi:hypothetical protein AWB80_08485 [Caballeronia pedi]|uniref:Uncharacterized protein n=1 Tax=Caballeronia pedi TaxID=1777141 RepID=A0A158E836_9BURK|nr:hypothetical protein AWB80_08485 [Caballeronia pedi]
MIVAAQKLDIAIGAITGEIARAVHAGARNEGTRDKPLCRERRPSQIAGRKTCAADVKLPGDTKGHGAQIFVEHVCTRVGKRLSDGNRRAIGDVVAQHMGQHAYGRFGRAIVIEDAQIGFECLQGHDPLGPGRLAAQHQQLRGQRRSIGHHVDECAQMTRHDLEDADLIITHVLSEEISIGGPLGREHVQCMSCHQGAEQDRMSEVGGDG